MANAPELKNCPFCGHSSATVDTGEICCPIEHEACVRCSECDAQGPGAYRHHTEQDAILEAVSLWDVRADLATSWHRIGDPDNPPPRWERVLLLRSNGGYRIDSWGHFDAYNQPNFTHWMHLPPPPKEGE